MASITLEGRNELIALYTAMYKAAPGANNLNDMVAMIESGKTLLQVAQTYTAKAEFATVYPTLLTADEFAANLVANMLGSEVSAGASTWATNWVKTQLAAGKGPAFVIATAVQSLRATTSTDFANAKAMLANKTEVAAYYSVTKLQSDPDLADLQTVISGITSAATTVTAAKLVVDGIAAATSGKIFELTTGVDTVVGTSGNDVINGQSSGTPTSLTGLDSIDGGAGEDTLNVFDVTGAAGIPAITVTNVEKVNVSAAFDGTLDSETFDFTAGYSGLKSVTVSAAGTPDSDLTVINGSGVAATVSAASKVVMTGGASQTVTTKGTVALSGSTGDISATVTAQTAAATITGGAKVTASAAASVADAGTGAALTIGGVATALQPTGAVTITQTVAADSDGGDITSGALTVTGGSTISVTRSTTNVSDAAAGNTTTFGAVTITGGAATTTVSVTQPTMANERMSEVANAGTKETQAYTFSGADLAAGATVTLEGLTLTAVSAMTAAEVAAAFANLAANATQGNSIKGAYSGTLTGWGTGAVTAVSSTASSVTFTASLVGDSTVVAPAGTGVAIVAVGTNVVGTAAADNFGAGFTAVAGVVDGAVTITDGATVDTVKSVTLSAYGTGSTITSDALTSLSLANNPGLGASSTGAAPVLVAVAPATLAVTNTLATSLDLTVNGLGRTAAGVNTFASVDIGATYKSLNLIGSGNNAWVTLTAAGVETLTVSGDKTVNLLGTGGATVLTALKSITVSGSAGLTVKAAGATTTSVNTSATTGAVTITNLDATTATYTGGAGKDTVTLTAAVATKAIDLGAGDDKLVIGVSSSTSDIKGGDGNDTLSMTGALADAADASAAFAAKVTGFEVLELTTPAADTIDLSVLGFTKVTTGAATGLLTLNKMASGGTLTLTSAVGAGSYVVGVTDAATGTADSLKLAVASTTAGAVAFGSVTAADVESVSISGSYTGVFAQTAAHTLTLVATKATTITVTGNETLDITNAGNTAVTKIDGSAMVGGLIVTAAGTVATTITGGSGADSLTASTGAGAKADTLIGGAGNDTLTSNTQLSTLTGGAGADKFVIVSPANVNSYSTVTDATAGDKIVIGSDLGVETFQKSAVTLGDTAVFQDFANAAVNAGGATAGYIAWFQFGGNTYIVQNTSAGTTDFQNGSDTIVKLTGLVDLSGASISTTGTATLQLN